MALVLPNLPAFLAGLFFARSLTSATVWGLTTKLLLVAFIALYWTDSGNARPQGDVALSVVVSLLFGVLGAWIGYGLRRALTYGPTSSAFPSPQQIISNPALLLDETAMKSSDRWAEAYERELKRASAKGLKGETAIAEAQYEVVRRADRQKTIDVVFGTLIWISIIGGMVWLAIAYLT